MKHIRNMKDATRPALAHHLRPYSTDLEVDNRVGLGAGAIPEWSPSGSETAVPKPLDKLFPRTYFDSVRAAPPSPTMMRHFNEKIARMRKRGLAPEWMPNQKFSPTEMPHLLALAFSQGASGALDLADVISDIPKLLTKLGEAALKAGKIMEVTEGHSGVLKALVLVAATSMIGLRWM